jgi:hypothetical protein
MKHSSPLIALIVLLATFPALLGCTQEMPSSREDALEVEDPSSEADVRSVPLIDDTPEAVFASMREAAEYHDYHTFAACWTESSQNKIAVGLVQGYLEMSELRQHGASSNVDSMREVIERYEIDAEMTGAILDSVGLSLEERIAEAGELIQDKPSFIGEAMAVVRRVSEKDEVIQGKLDFIRIEGDQAVGWCDLPGNGGEVKIEFFNTPEGWRIELPEAVATEEEIDETPQ